MANCDCGTTSFGRFGAWAGDKAYNLAAKRIKTWTGYGDYRIASNSLITGGGLAENGQPVITTQGRSTRISYREYLGEVVTGPTTGAFHSTTYVVNPANIFTFPWLSGIAAQYDQYKPLGIIFEFRSTATDTTTSASLGSVLISSEYDPNDAKPTSKQQMMNSAYASESKMSQGMLHGLECDPEELQRKVFYTRPITTSTGSVDARDYDLCFTTIATQGGGLNPNESVGSLYIHYDFEFFKEQLVNGIQSKNRIHMRVAASGTSGTPATMLGVFGLGNIATTSPPAGIVKGLLAGVDLGIEVVGSDGLNFPRKWAGSTFLIQWFARCDTAIALASAPTLGINIGLAHADNPTLEGQTTGMLSTINPFRYARDATPANGQGMFIETMVKLDDIVTTEFATMGMTQLGMLGTGNYLDNWYYEISIELVPSSFYMSGA